MDVPILHFYQTLSSEKNKLMIVTTKFISCPNKMDILRNLMNMYTRSEKIIYENLNYIKYLLTSSAAEGLTPFFYEMNESFETEVDAYDFSSQIYNITQFFFFEFAKAACRENDLRP